MVYPNYRNADGRQRNLMRTSDLALGFALGRGGGVRLFCESSNLLIFFMHSMNPCQCLAI